jgi:hypothetical protein
MSKRKLAQMSKRKSSTAAKRAHHPKTPARAQRKKETIVRSPKDKFLRSVPVDSVEPRPKLHVVSAQETPNADNGKSAFQDDPSRNVSASNQTKVFALAVANPPTYSAKLLEITQANVLLAFEFGSKIAMTKSPTEFLAVSAEFIRRRIDMFGQHSKELAAYPFWQIQDRREITALPGRDGKPHCSGPA